MAGGIQVNTKPVAIMDRIVQNSIIAGGIMKEIIEEI